MVFDIFFISVCMNIYCMSILHKFLATNTSTNVKQFICICYSFEIKQTSPKELVGTP